MAETSSRSSEFPVIDYKKASSKDVQRVLVQVTGQKKWENADSWKFYLKSRNTIFNNIAKSSEFGGLDWRDPDSWTPLEEEYISRSKREARSKPREGEIPLWALDGNWMDSYPEIVQWMRREHWRNNKAKLIDLFNKCVPQEPNQPTTSGESTVGEAGDAGSGGNWQDVMLRR